MDAAPRGVIVVSIDTLRADYTSPYGAPADATPTLARLAEESVVFEHAYSQANETLFSHGALFTSKLPSHVGPVNYDWTIPDDVPTLAEAFSAAGWKTAAVVAGAHLARVFGLDDGFAEYTEGERWGSFQQTVPMAVRWLRQRKDDAAPFFLFVHGYDCHAPYPKPGPFRKLALPGYQGPLLEQLFNIRFYEQIYQDTWYPDFDVSPIQTPGGRQVLDPGSYARLPAYAASNTGTKLSEDDLRFLKGSYAVGALYADLWLGVLLNELARLGLDETTTVVVMSDHGEGLLDHGFMNHRQTLLDEATHVPLLVRAPGVPAGRVSEVVSLIDVAPTLLEMTGVAGLPEAEGRSLVPCLEGESKEVCGAPVAVSEGVLTQVSATDGQYRLVVRGLAADDPELDAAIRSQDPRIEETWTGEPDPAAQTKLRTTLLAARAAGRSP